MSTKAAQAARSDGACIERVTPGDLMYVGLENRDWPLHFGGLAVVDGGPLLEADGALDLPGLEVLLERRLDRVPRLRQRIHDPGPLRGRPIWADDPHFSIDEHVNVLEVPAPGGEDELLHAATRLHERPLNPRRPRWELWLLTGLASGRVGILLKLHHSIADGLGAVAVMTSLFDLEPNAGDPTPTPWTPAPVPSSGALLADSVAQASRRARKALVVLTRPRDLAGQVGSLGRTTRGFFGTMAAPGSSINRRVRAGRRVGVLRLDVDDVRQVARARGGRVNDVVLTLWAAGLRGLLQARGEATEGVELVASVPVSLRSADESAVVANRVGVMIVPLPVGGADPRARLDAVVAATGQAKARQQPAAIMGFMARLASTPFGRRYTERQRAINVQVTNVPGPTEPVHLLGARVLEILPFISLAGNVGLTLCAFSYCGRLSLVVTADRTAFPDLDELTAAMHTEWDALAAAQEGRRPQPS